MARARARLCCLGLAACAWLGCALARAEEALPARGEQYQGKSARQFADGSQGLWWDFKQLLVELDVTRAKALIVVGVVGAVLTLNKNKRMFHWGVVAALSYLLIAAGALCVHKGWLN